MLHRHCLSQTLVLSICLRWILLTPLPPYQSIVCLPGAAVQGLSPAFSQLFYNWTGNGGTQAVGGLAWRVGCALLWFLPKVLDLGGDQRGNHSSCPVFRVPQVSSRLGSPGCPLWGGVRLEWSLPHSPLSDNRVSPAPEEGGRMCQKLLLTWAVGHLIQEHDVRGIPKLIKKQ